MFAALLAVAPGSEPRVAAQPTPPPIRVYGEVATFGSLTAQSPTKSGHEAVGVAVADWGYDAATDTGWRKGTAAWFAERTQNGRIVMGSVPLTMNQTKPTMKSMSMGVFDPATETFAIVKIPTDKPPSPGLTYEAAFPGNMGGADVSDLCVVDVDPGPAVDERVVGISYLPYKSWNTANFGKFPGLVYLADSGGAGAGAVTQDLGLSKTPELLRDTLPPTPEGVPPSDADLAFPMTPAAFATYPDYASMVGTNECSVLASGDIVIVQYATDQTHFPGSRSGRIVVLGPDGTLKDFFQIPDYETAAPVKVVPFDGSPIHVAAAGLPMDLLPREVEARPVTAPDGSSRFVVVFDAFVREATTSSHAPFPLQEFSWDGSAITPTSALLASPDDTGVPLDLTTKRSSFSHMAHAPDGTLFVSQIAFAGVGLGGPFAEDLVVYSPGTLEQHPPGVDPLPGAPRTDYGIEAVPDQRIDAAAYKPSFPTGRPIRATRSLHYDAARQKLVGVSWRGELRAYDWVDTATPPTPYCDVDLGVDQLVPEPNNDRIVGGALDEATGTLYLPYGRRGDRTDEEIVDQFLYAVDLDGVLTTARPDESGYGCPGGPSGSAFHATVPARILDSRTTTGGWNTKLAAGAPRTLQVGGAAGVPATAAAVAMNVTVTESDAGSFLSVWPAGVTRPNSSNVNFAPGETIPNQVVVRLGTGGQVSFATEIGATHVIADVVGWFDDGTIPGDLFTGLGPARILDSRGANGGWFGPLGPGDANVRGLQVRGRGGVPLAATAVIMNVTVTQATAGSFVQVWPSGATRPNSSNLNFAAGQTIPNLVTVQLGSAGQVSFFNAVGSTHVVADVVGYFTATTGSRFHSLGAPTRILDDRVGIGLIGPWGPGSNRTLSVAGANGIPAAAVAYVANGTATNATNGSFVTFAPSGGSVPTASNLNFGPGQTIANLVVGSVGAGGSIDIFNALGTVDLIADAVGYFAPT